MNKMKKSSAELPAGAHLAEEAARHLRPLTECRGVRGQHAGA